MRPSRPVYSASSSTFTRDPPTLTMWVSPLPPMRPSGLCTQEWLHRLHERLRLPRTNPGLSPRSSCLDGEVRAPLLRRFANGTSLLSLYPRFIAVECPEGVKCP